MGIGTRAIVSYCLILAGSEVVVVGMAASHAASPQNPVYQFIFYLRSILFFGPLAVLSLASIGCLLGLALQKRKEKEDVRKQAIIDRERAIDSKINEVKWSLKDETAKLQNALVEIEAEYRVLRKRVRGLEDIVLVEKDEAAKAAISDFA